ncbi:hypothetical protein LIT25_08430 [Bacillus sp. F19]|nr:hypothetical protein LIT25_08430 [Bacillus sp. F19]
MIVPMSAAVIAFYKLDVPVMLLVSFCISAIEVLFLYLEIYEHYWWKTYFTTYYFQPGWFSDAARDHIGGLLIVQLLLLQKDFVVSFHGFFSFAALHLFIAGVSSLVWISFLQKKNRKK